MLFLNRYYLFKHNKRPLLYSLMPYSYYNTVSDKKTTQQQQEPKHNNHRDHIYMANFSLEKKNNKRGEKKRVVN